MTLPLTRRAADVYRPTTSGGAPRGPNIGEAQTYHVEVEALLLAAIADALDIEFPYSIVKASNAGAGTANAIKATTERGLSSADSSVLVSVNIVAENTGPATVEFNADGNPLHIITSSGDALSAGYLQPGMRVWGSPESGNFRLISDVAVADILVDLQNAISSVNAAQGQIDNLIAILDPDTAAIERTVDTFTTVADVNHDYELSVAPEAKSLIDLIVGGVPQEQSAFTLTGANIRLVDEPEAGLSMEAKYYLRGHFHAASGATGRALELAATPTAAQKIIRIRPEIIPDLDVMGIGGNDTAAILGMAMQAAADGASIYFPPAADAYRITSLEWPDGVPVICHPEARFEVTGALGNLAISSLGTLGTGYALSADADRGDLLLPTTHGSAFSVGDDIVIRTLVYLDGTNYPIEEVNRVARLVSGGIVLEMPLRFDHTLSPGTAKVHAVTLKRFNWDGGVFNISRSRVEASIDTANGSDEIAVDSASGLAVGMLVEAAGVPSTTFIGGIAGLTISLVNSSGAPVDATATATGVDAVFHAPQGGGFRIAYFAEGSSLTRTVVDGSSDWPAFSMFYGHGGLLEDIRGRNGQGMSAGGYGYCWALGPSCSAVQVINTKSRRCRESSISARVRDVIVRGHISEGDEVNAVNTHASDCEAVLIEGCIAHGTQLGTAFKIAYDSGITDDRNCSIKDCIARNLQGGGIEIAGGTSYVSPNPSYVSKGIIVEGCIIENYGLGAGAQIPAINIKAVNAFRVAGNIIRKSNNADPIGILAFNSSDGDIQGNVTEAITDGSDGEGIILNTCSRVGVSDNRSIATPTPFKTTGSNPGAKFVDNEADNNTVSISGVHQQGNSWQGREQAGQVSVDVSGGTGTASVVFAREMPNTGYAVDTKVIGSGLTSFPSSLATTGFTMNVAGADGTYTVTWNIKPFSQ